MSGTKDRIEKKIKTLLEQGYKAFKMKVGRLTVDEDIDLVAGVRNTIGHKAILRLDANRAWSVHDALNFMQRAQEFNIDYLEEPAKSLDQLIKILHESTLPVNVALDESLMEISPQELPLLPALKAIVIKPTLLGFDRAMRFARVAKDKGITAVISSSFESSLGLCTLASMAAVTNGGHVPAGLDTLDWLEDDLLEPSMRIQSGKIFLTDDASFMGSIKMDLLEEIT